MRSTSGNNPIYLEVIVPTGLSILGPSDTFESCANNYGISVSSSKRVFDLFLNAIDYNETCRAMMIIFPRGEDELRDLAQLAVDECFNLCPRVVLGVYRHS
jgi:hypothetical protein